MHKTFENGAVIIGGDFQGLGIVHNLAGLRLPIIIVDPDFCIGRFSSAFSVRLMSASSNVRIGPSSVTTSWNRLYKYINAKNVYQYHEGLPEMISSKFKSLIFFHDYSALCKKALL